MSKKLQSPPVWRIDIRAPLPTHAVFELAFEDDGFAMSSYEDQESKDWYFQLLTFEEPNAAAMKKRAAAAARDAGVEDYTFEMAKVPSIDWVSHTNRLNAPVHAGRFFLYGSHDKGKTPVGALPLLVEAGLAFGTGRAPSTFGCLLAIDWLAARGELKSPVLDLGCGSAVLAMAAARTGAKPVMASDIDPIAVRVAQENVTRNGLGHRVRCCVSTGFRNRDLRRGPAYGVVIANILSRPLARLAPHIHRRLSPGGYVILSGLLGRDQWEVLPRYRALGLRLVRRISRENWTTLVLQRSK